MMMQLVNAEVRGNGKHWAANCTWRDVDGETYWTSESRDTEAEAMEALRWAKEIPPPSPGEPWKIYTTKKIAEELGLSANV